MYHIIEFKNGQPVVLWQSGNNLHKYIIASGRVFSKGILINDINRNFEIINTAPVYVTYESVDGSNVICQLSEAQILEVFTSKHHISSLQFNNILYVFSLIPNENLYNLCFCSSKNFNEQHILCENINYSANICVHKFGDYIIVLLDDTEYILNNDFEIVKTLALSVSDEEFCENTTTDIHKNPETYVNKISSVNNDEMTHIQSVSNSPNQYAILERDMSELKYKFYELEQQHNDFVKEYEHLSSYTGKLQEELRRTKILVSNK